MVLIQNDITGNRFGKLVVLSFYSGHNANDRKYFCACDCGRKVIVSESNLKRGKTKSCGCIRSKRGIGVGESKQRLYSIWNGMLNRCENKKAANYQYYGGNGITICPEWHNYTNFKEWAMRNGYQDNLTIDRVDVCGAYSPDNCRWVTQKEQTRNRRNNVKHLYKGEWKCVTELAEEYGLKVQVVKNRLLRGDTMERALRPAQNYRGKRK